MIVCCTHYYSALVSRKKAENTQTHTHFHYFYTANYPSHLEISLFDLFFHMFPMLCSFIFLLLAGDSRGCVDVYKVVGVDLTPRATREEQNERLLKAVLTADAEG